MRENDLNELPLEFERFLEFYDGRRERIEQRLRTLLGSTPSEHVVAPVMET
jgi:hypothetical protein